MIMHTEKVGRIKYSRKSACDRRGNIHLNVAVGTAEDWWRMAMPCNIESVLPPFVFQLQRTPLQATDEIGFRWSGEPQRPWT